MAADGWLSAVAVTANFLLTVPVAAIVSVSFAAYNFIVLLLLLF
jgi:hypothetical protein